MPSTQQSNVPEADLADALALILANDPRPTRIEMVLVPGSNPPVWIVTRHYP